MGYLDPMDPLAFFIVILIVLFSVATILINIFFIYCMFSSQEGPENLQKPPLNILLGLLIGCNLVLSICSIFFVMHKDVGICINFFDRHASVFNCIFFSMHKDVEWMHVCIPAYVFAVAACYAMRTSFTASLGLNIFYYIQIVPARKPFLIWVKAHIKLFIYLIMFFGNILLLFEIIFTFLLMFDFFLSDEDLNSCSGSLNSSSASLNTTFNELIWRHVCLLLSCLYFLFCLGIMVASNTSTVRYLWRHVRRMEDSGSFSALCYQKQKRVAILSIIQTVLFFIYSAGLVLFQLFGSQVFFYSELNIYFSVFFTFYCFATTIIIGVGQTKFRLCAVDIWKKIGQTISGSNLNVGDRNGHFNCCLNCCYSNTENGEMLTIAHI